MPPSKNNFLDHVRWLRQAVQAQGAELIIAGDSMQALIRADGRHWALYPQFLAVVDEVSQYTPVLTDDVTHFVGWLPYRPKRWPLATDKLLFKRYAQQVGLRIPDFSVDPETVMSDVVVKRAASSFGEQVRGPFRHAAECRLSIAEGDYYERYVEGEILKAWFWNGEAVVLEVDTLPRATGDGIATLETLFMRRANMFRQQTPARLAMLRARSETVLRYHGKQLSDVLPDRARQVLEFRYGSDLMHPLNRSVIDLRAAAGDRADWAELIGAGRALYLGIPRRYVPTPCSPSMRFAGPDRQIWLLEMNSNPAVHPLVYPAITDALVGSVAQARAARSTIAATA